MIAAVMSDRPLRPGDPDARALAWRAASGWTRAAQATLIGGLVWFATGDRLALVCLAVALGLSFVDAWVSQWALGRPQTRGVRAAAASAHLLSAMGFCSVVLPLERAPSPVHLAGAVLMLCAVSLNNALMARGSRLTLWTLIGPSSLLLMASPLLARLFGYPMAMADVTVLSAAGAFFVVFILRLAATFNDEGQSLRDALEALRLQTEAAQTAERAAEESRRRWRMIFDQGTLAQGVFNASKLHEFLRARARPGQRLGDVLRTNLKAPAELLEYVELLGSNDLVVMLRGERPDAARFGPCFIEGFADALSELSPDGVMPPFLTRMIRADGQVVDVEAHFRIAQGDGPPWSLCLATYVDVTAARRAAREQLEALRAAEVANRAKSDFLAVISHELRTPLNGVLGMAQAMAAAPLARAQRDRLEVIRDSGAGLLAIVDDLLDLARIEAGELELVNADFDLGKLVDALQATFAPKAAARGLDFKIEVAPSLPGRCHGDVARVRHVLEALMCNALKFTPQGEVSLRLGPGPRGLRFEVSDTGVGIAPDRLDKLFQPFGLADSSLTRRHGGAGLGLALSRQVVRAMGGDISVQSQPGAGSRFTVDAPLAPPPDRRAGDGDSRALAPLDVRVLAAEDNPVNQRVLATLLAQVGVTPTFVENGLEAVRAWEEGEWDLILMDVQMPVMDGVAATREIRAREARLGRARAPIIAVTANAMRHQLDDYRAAGMTEVISKPIDIQQLFAAMVAAVALSDAA
jgi:signal transduction histidine kinase